MGIEDNASKLAEYREIAASVTDRVKKVAVLYGGTSGEREVSIASGTGAKDVLEEEGFSVRFIDTGKPGFIEELLADRPDVAFIAMHGKGGEDGGIQGFLETLGIPYTQSGVESSAIAMDKIISKILYEAYGLATAAYLEVRQGSLLQVAEVDEILEKIGLPCVVKPSCDGSSLGVAIPKTQAELLQAIKEGFTIGETLLIEDFIEGVEVTVPVIGNRPEELFALPVIEIVPKNEFYDYESKYAEGGSVHIVPARISDSETELCKQTAIKAHEILGCAGVSRTDMILSEDGIAWVIETNTVPGMTRTSLIPEGAKSFGLTVGELYRLLLHYALCRS